MKYRIWDNKDKRYVKVVEDLNKLKGENFLTNGKTVFIVKEVFDGVRIFKDINQEKFIIELSTGLLDKNGKEIYEGDIIVIDGNQRIVIYKESHARFYAECDDLYYDISFMYDIEVIGTIHDEGVKNE